MIVFIKLFKVYPFILNIQLLINVTLCLFDIDISRWVNLAIGASIYTIILCFIASYIFSFCLWYRVLCSSSIISLILEWVDMNIVKLDYLLYEIQFIVIVAMLISIIIYLRGRKLNKRNNKGPQPIDF